MDSSGLSSFPQIPVGLDKVCEQEYTSQSKLHQEFAEIATIDKAWTFTSPNGYGSQGMFAISQPNLLANVRRRCILSSHISKESSDSVSFHWTPFPVEMTGVSAIVPSPSGSKLLVVRNYENEFERISWNFDETLIPYVAGELVPSKPTFTCFGYKRGTLQRRTWLTGKVTVNGRRTGVKLMLAKDSLHFLLSTSSGPVVWAPSSENSDQYLVFVGWPSDARKLSIKYCHNRACSLYSVKAPFSKSETSHSRDNASEDVSMVSLTRSISSAFFSMIQAVSLDSSRIYKLLDLSVCKDDSPDGKYLVFLSTRAAVDSGANWATNSLHRIDWPADGTPCQSAKIVEVVHVGLCPEDGCFPGLYLLKILSKPWLSDSGAILSVNVLRQVLLALYSDSIIAVLAGKASTDAAWNWLDVASPVPRCSEKVRSLLSSRQFDILKIPVRDVSENLTKENPTKPYLFLQSLKRMMLDPVIVFLDGGPHSVSLPSVSKSLAFLSSLNYSFLIVNCRGSLGFGEKALQSLPGKIGSQAPDKFAAACARNPICNLALMKWLSPEHLTLSYKKSPISHISKVKTPTLFLLGAKDLRVPVSLGIQYARALKEKGSEVKVSVKPVKKQNGQKPHIGKLQKQQNIFRTKEFGKKYDGKNGFVKNPDGKIDKDENFGVKFVERSGHGSQSSELCDGNNGNFGISQNGFVGNVVAKIEKNENLEGKFRPSGGHGSVLENSQNGCSQSKRGGIMVF
ncbi:hypothetical protein ACH5RR_033139 [Cinchona calisaya]|uniref:acylaminoacyl-peptidase n=1 Tax=Cinchona calisaya TaxID=153742 RepID=A0ABD2YN89_9GENT